MRHVDTGAVRLAVETWPAGGALDPARTVIGIHGLTAAQVWHAPVGWHIQ